MKERDAKRQLCKMQGKVADHLGLKTRCVCDDAHEATENSEVPDEVISELWRRIRVARMGRRTMRAKKRTYKDGRVGYVFRWWDGDEKRYVGGEMDYSLAKGYLRDQVFDEKFAKALDEATNRRVRWILQRAREEW